MSAPIFLDFQPSLAPIKNMLDALQCVSPGTLISACNSNLSGTPAGAFPVRNLGSFPSGGLSCTSCATPDQILNLDRSDSVPITEGGYLDFPDRVERKKMARTIYPEMRLIQVEEFIRLKADELYRKDDITGRQSKRQLMIYYYLVRAYNETRTPYNPHYLAKAAKMSATKIQTAMCTFTKIVQSNSTRSIIKQPRDYVESQLLHTGLSVHHVPDVLALIDELLEKDEDLHDTQPQIFSAAAILYFMELEQVPIPDDFRSKINIPKSTLENMHKLICKTHNS